MARMIVRLYAVLNVDGYEDEVDQDKADKLVVDAFYEYIAMNAPREVLEIEEYETLEEWTRE